MKILIFLLGLGIGLLSALPNHPERPKPVCQYYTLRPGHLSKIRK